MNMEPKIPKAKLITSYKSRVNYSVKTIDELASMLETHGEVIVVINGKYYRVKPETLEETN